MFDHQLDVVRFNECYRREAVDFIHENFVYVELYGGSFSPCVARLLRFKKMAVSLKSRLAMYFFLLVGKINSVVGTHIKTGDINRTFALRKRRAI